MAITYAWTLNELIVKPQDGPLADVVILVNWVRSATDGDYTSSCYGQVSVGPVDPSGFTPYEDLTKPQVEGWVVASLTQAQVNAYDASLAAEIERQRNPPTINKVAPWSA